MTKDVLYPEEVRMAAIDRVTKPVKEWKRKRIYLACPYSARLSNGTPDETLMHLRFLQVCAMAGKIIEDGYVVFSPISHSVPIADTLDNHLDADFWLGQDSHFIEWADEVWVLMLPGWEDSAGVKREIAMAEKIHKPVMFISMNAYDHIREIMDESA